MFRYRYIGRERTHLMAAVVERELEPGDEFDSPVELRNGLLLEIPLVAINRKDPAKPDEVNGNAC